MLFLRPILPMRLIRINSSDALKIFKKYVTIFPCIGSWKMFLKKILQNKKSLWRSFILDKGKGRQELFILKTIMENYEWK